MAVVRGRSTPPYATVIFVFLWVISTGIAIWLGVEKGKADRDRDAAELRAKTSSEAQLVNQGQVANWAGFIYKGENNAVPAMDVALNNARDALKDAGFTADVSFTKALTSLNERLKQAQTNYTQALQAKEDAERARDSAVKAQTAAQAAGVASLNSEKAKYEKADAEAAKVRADKTAELGVAQAAFTKAQGDWENERKKIYIEMEQLKADLVASNNTIKGLRDQLVNLRKPSSGLAALPPAGTVVRARAGTGECYISLGRKDRIQPGFTFSVHDPRIGIKLPAEPDATKQSLDAGGKAAIEVVQVGETESLCRVTRETKGQHVENGDLLANPLYQQDKNKKYHFVVFGDFDLDADNVATPGEHDRVVRMIATYGGVVDEEISPETDYLVLGVRPTAASNKAATTEPGGVVSQQVINQKKYDDLYTEARRSSVPILNANRFLALIGYYNNTVAP